MDTSCCSLSVKVVFQNSSRLGNRPRCKVPFNQDIAFPSFTAISSDKASFLPNAQYQSLACAASLLTIQTQQENTFARASSSSDFPELCRRSFKQLIQDNVQLSGRSWFLCLRASMRAWLSWEIPRIPGYTILNSQRSSLWSETCTKAKKQKISMVSLDYPYSVQILSG